MLDRAPSRSDQVLLFARNFFKHPKMLGSLIPSSRFLIQNLLRQVDWAKARTIVEYGPGIGSFTMEILRRLPPDGRLIAIETNRDFVRMLQNCPDPRLHVVQGSAADVDQVLNQLQIDAADYIISGIPFSTLPPAVRESILHKTHAVLQPQGRFLVYQFTSEVFPHLKIRFREVHQDFELLNILPAKLFYCRK